MDAPESGRIESSAMPERRADDGVVDGREMLEHVNLIDDQRITSVARRSSRTAAATASSASSAVARSISRHASLSHSSDAWWTAWNRCSS